MNLLTELRRRNVFRMAVLYVVSAWLVLQVGDVLFGVLGVPDWSLRLLLAFLALGFPFALIFSWIYELTPEGVKKESEVDRTTSVTPQTGRKIDRLIIVVLAIAVVVLLVDRWRFTESDPVSTAETRTASAPETDAGQAADVRSIAVLPFADFSGGDDQAWFARGLAEEILNALARTPDLMVAARTSSFRYTDSELPVTEIAQELGVAHVLEGSVRRAPDRIRVTAQLIRAEDGFHLWSENYDRKSDDIIAIQEDIARSIAIALETAMDPDALAAMMSAGTRSVEAYDTYLKALAEAGDSWADGTYDVQQAVENLERSVRLDPTFARAHEFLSLQYRGLANTSIMSRSAEDKTPAEYRERFEAAIEAAIRHASNEVDRTYYEAIKANAEQRLALSQDRYRAYLDARPNDARAITEYAGILIARGDLTAARGALEPIVSGAVQSSWPTRLQAGNLLLFSGSPDEGIALFDQILATDPDNAGALYEKHRALLWPQRFEEASQVVEEMRRAPPMPAHQQENVAIREACAAGDRDAAEALLNAMGPDHPFGRWYGALLLGYKDRAATALAPMDETEAGLDDLAGYLVFPHFDPSPYPRLMARIGNDLVREKPIVETLPFACPPAERPSVAVLPFTTRSRNEDDLFFSDGVHDDLLTQLAKIGGLKVISRTSVMEYRDTPKNLREIGDELGA
ncbi:MAG: tetratricopeptide repeat protein, partial [Pseudomonadota bacterium]